jgi:hypothetical protein
MAVTRQSNFLSQQRVDIPHLRALESAVAGDFDVLAGRALAGEAPLVLRGFTPVGVAVGASAVSLRLMTADALVFNMNAAESGTFLWVPLNRPIETLNPTTNPRITGGWTAGAANFVGLEFVRLADDSTTDLVEFRDPITAKDTPKLVPLARTLDYRIRISTVPFSAEPTVAPLAIVTLDGAGFVAACYDARAMMFRLGRGGDAPDRYSSFAGWTRTDEPFGTNTDADFTGGDKSISSMKGWMDAVMTRLWEVGGGSNWYSQAADRNVTLSTIGSPFPNGEYFQWNAGTQTVQWQGLRISFSDSASYSAYIQDGMMTPFRPGQALYVDLDRSATHAPAWAPSQFYVTGALVSSGANAYEAVTGGVSGLVAPAGTGLVGDGTVTWQYLGAGALPLIMQVGDLETLSATGASENRWVVAWRVEDQVFTRGWRYPVGTLFVPATPTGQGVLKISRDYTGEDTPGTSGLNDPIALSDRGGIITAPTAIPFDRAALIIRGGSIAQHGLYVSPGTTLTPIDWWAAIVGDSNNAPGRSGVLGRGTGAPGVVGIAAADPATVPTAFVGREIGVAGAGGPGAPGIAGISEGNNAATDDLNPSYQYSPGGYGAGSDNSGSWNAFSPRIFKGFGGPGYFGRGGALEGFGVIGIGGVGSVGPSTFFEVAFGAGGAFIGGGSNSNGAVAHGGTTVGLGLWGSAITDSGFVGIGTGMNGAGLVGISAETGTAYGVEAHGSQGTQDSNGLLATANLNGRAIRAEASGSGATIEAIASGTGWALDAERRIRVHGNSTSEVAIFAPNASTSNVVSSFNQLLVSASPYSHVENVQYTTFGNGITLLGYGGSGVSLGVARSAAVQIANRQNTNGALICEWLQRDSVGTAYDQVAKMDSYGSLTVNAGVSGGHAVQGNANVAGSYGVFGFANADNSYAIGALANGTGRVGLYVDSNNIGVLLGTTPDPISGVGVEAHLGIGATAFWSQGPGLGLAVDSDGASNSIEVTVTGSGTGAIINLLGADTLTAAKPCLQLLGSTARAPLNMGVLSAYPTGAAQNGDMFFLRLAGPPVTYYICVYIDGWRQTSI